MEVTIKPSFLRGKIYAPPSKSYTHRAIICSSLSNGKSRIMNYLKCNDTEETICVLRKFGVKIDEKNGMIEIEGNENLNKGDVIIDCIKESGSTLRFLIPVSAIRDGKTKFIRNGRMKERPVEALINALQQLGSKCYLDEEKNVIVASKIKGGICEIPGNISSQFISGLLFACPRAKEDTEINITTEIESEPYIEITIDVLNKFGIKIEKNGKKFKIKGNQHYKPQENFFVEGDFSSAAFFLAGGVINGDVEIKNLNLNSKQGDKEILNILKRMNGNIEIRGNSVHASKSNLKGIEIDAKNIPDLVPICAVLGCFADNETKIFNAERLRIKESDRLSAITTELKKMNANIEEKEGGLIIRKSKLKWAEIDPHNDHRIAMACAIAGLNAEGETIIKNKECVNKSYPEFFNDLKKLIQG